MAVLVRWRAVVRERRWAWFAVHQAGVGAIVAGWWLRGERSAAAVNGAWLAVATAWFLSRRRTP
ncbi:MAG TPA: hypothetical protein VHE80_08410 [Acidimicrobiales bacterium]|nr:hypothetical protein [Acidimicrobiales bacterium]